MVMQLQRDQVCNVPERVAPVALAGAASEITERVVYVGTDLVLPFHPAGWSA
jgi:hypothetical protein